jgi:hypothetical protein
MAIAIASFLIPKNGQSYFLLEDTYLRGGMRVSLDTTTRDALHPSTKKAGMFVWTQTEGVLWQLQADLTTYLAYSASAYYTFYQVDPASVWQIQHNSGSDRFVYNVYDDTSGIILPDQVVVVDTSTIEISFAVPVSGRCTFVFDLSQIVVPPPIV